MSVLTTKTILAEHTVSMSDLRKAPAQFFTDTPIAVLSHNETAGYVLGPALFEKLMAIVEASQPAIQGQFRPTHARLKEIARQGTDALLSASEADLSDFEEHPDL